jgi:sarcosine oxidase subunit gamma
VHDLAPLTALGGTAPKRDTIGTVEIVEITDLALASVAARLGRERDCLESLTNLLGARPPSPGTSISGADYSAFWMGPDQWMLWTRYQGNENIAQDLRAGLGAFASVTEQTDGWACFDVSGTGTFDLFERLCPVPVRRMASGTAQRTTIHHMGCCVICLDAGRAYRVHGARSSAGALHHALCTAATSIA